MDERVADHDWWHVIDLPDGSSTPGGWDLRRTAAEDIPWPQVAGKRCLDVGTADGFWAFELERRGGAAGAGAPPPAPVLARGGGEVGARAQPPRPGGGPGGGGGFAPPGGHGSRLIGLAVE